MTCHGGGDDRGTVNEPPFTVQPDTLRLIRRARNLTLVEVGRAMGRSWQRAQAIENARKPTPAAVAAFLAAVARCTPR